jgi:ubiquinone/menaquinone biosynthesis C-methylase UbiE
MIDPNIPSFSSIVSQTGAAMTRTEYALGNVDPQAERRFDELEDLFDASTVQYLTALGVSPGWSCWEVGAGSGSIARWLADMVGPTGSVLATDLDLRWLRDENPPWLTARAHNVVSDKAPKEAFDLVHARLVLVHLRQRERVLETLVRSLRPGGWILVEDFDHAFLDATTPVTAQEASVRRIHRGFRELLIQRGADLTYARGLPDLLRAHGLRGVAGEGRMTFAAGASAAARLLEANLLQVGDQMVHGNLCTRQELKTALELLHDPDHGFATPLLISAWGRQPRAAKAPPSASSR